MLTGFERTGERKEEFHREDRYFILAVAVLVGVLVVRSEGRLRPWLVAAVAPPALLFLFRVATVDPAAQATQSSLPSGSCMTT